jgi:putative transposase
MTEDDLRSQLMERIRYLPPERLTALERLLAQWERPAPENDALHRDWPRAPVHRISEHGTFLVTAGTLYKHHHFADRRRLDLLEARLLELAKRHGWDLEVWAVFSNHYHFLGHSAAASASLKNFLGHLHSVTATAVNKWDGTPERQVWYNHFDTRLTYERSYLARLNHVHQNAVRHGLVRVANQYRWCSAAWFERTATPAQVKTIYAFKIDRLRVLDDFETLASTD